MVSALATLKYCEVFPGVMGMLHYSRESSFRDLLKYVRNRAYGAATPSKEYEGPPPSDSPLPVGTTRNRPPNPPTKKGTRSYSAPSS